jgi:hypothetical protein
MSEPLSSGSPPLSATPAVERLESWKEIGAYLKRDVTTVQRWEKREGMPVHRHLHDKMGSVYAFRPELDAWARSRNLRLSGEGAPAHHPLEKQPHVHESLAAPNTRWEVSPVGATLGSAAPRNERSWLWPAAAAGTVLAVGAILWLAERNGASWENPVAGARFLQVTDFEGAAQAAAISRDGKLVAFLSDRDGGMDVWVTQVGTGQFHNLTRGTQKELVNPSVRTIGFSPDGALVTFWVRQPNAPKDALSIWAVPTLGGEPQPYLEGVAEFDWSRDGSRLVYHTPGPGDPMFVRSRDRPTADLQILVAPPGLHAHFPLWSPDDSFVYFVQGTVPDAMDVWRR